MATILLIRHGDNDYLVEARLAGRLPGVHLNEKGRQQAQQLAQTLAGQPVKAVYSSPLERAVETAKPAAEALGLDILLSPGLNEIDCGEWQGKTLKELRRRKLWKRVHHHPSRMRFPGGESFAEAQQRICHTLETLAGQYAAKDTVLCVSHSDPIKLAAAYFLGMPLDMFQRLTISPASMTAIHLGETGVQALFVNNETPFSSPQR